MTHDKLKMLMLACALLALLTVAFTQEAVGDSTASAPPTLGTMELGASGGSVVGRMSCWRSGGSGRIGFQDRLGNTVGGISSGNPQCTNPDSRCRTGFGSGAFAVYLNTTTTSMPSGTTAFYLCMK